MQERRIRWWPAVAIASLAIVALGLTWVSDTDRQSQVMQTILVLFLTSILLLVWVALFSRMPRRGWVALGLVALLVAIVSVVRIEGVDGDLTPILAWRWHSEAAAPAVGTAVGAAVGSAIGDRAGEALDFPQFLGRDRDGRVEVTLESDWQAHPPRELWRRPVGAGWAGFAIVNGLAVTHAQSGDDEVVLALDLASGEPRWSHQYPARYATTVGGTGPRSVPTIADGRVFALGGTGVLTALDLATGERLWQRDIVAENDAIVPDWGKAGSPLVLDDLVIVSAGGTADNSLLAYSVESGAVRWSAGSDIASYSIPVVLDLAGRSQVVMFNQETVVGHDPVDGRVLWSHEVPKEQPNVAPPIALDEDSLYISTGYGVGGRRIELAADGDNHFIPTLEWKSPRLKSKFANVILEGGVLCGLDDGVLAAIDPLTGERLWKKGRYGHGQLLLAGEHLLVQTEKGEVVLLAIDADGPTELSRFRVFSGKTWNPPALAGRFLVVRNDEEAVAYELPVPGL